jgi:hypothetical protein
MSRIIIVIVLFISSFSSFAQISTPEKRKFNIGVYAGLSIWKYKPMVALDLNYKGTTLRVMPNYNYYAIGLTQEIMKLSPVFYNLYWTGSVYGGIGTESVKYALNTPGYSGLKQPDSPPDYTKTTYTYIVNTGLKTYFAKRMYTHVMGGVMVNNSQGGGQKNSEVLPYFEFGIGFLFFKTYPALKREETQE